MQWHTPLVKLYSKSLVYAAGFMLATKVPAEILKPHLWQEAVYLQFANKS